MINVSISEILAKYYANLKVEDIPENIFLKTKQIILDYLGCAIGGANGDSSKIVKKVYAAQKITDGSTVLLNGKTSVEKAAFVNASYGHSLEMDDLNLGAGGHPAVVIIPAAIAMAEKQNANGLELLVSVIVAYDLMYRIGRAANSDSQFKRGLHPTSINGTFAAAIAGAILLRLNPKQTANAVGIAGSYTSGNLECYTDGALTKRINPAVGAQGGVMSALLAAEGYTGPRFIFEGRSGFLCSYTDAGESKYLTENLNYVYKGILATGFKPYAGCRYNHSGINAALNLRVEHNIDHKEIDEVIVRVVSMAVRAVCEPKEVKYNPQNIVDAQFSLPYSIAVALIKGKVFIEEYTDKVLYDTEVRSLMQKVKMEHSPELDKMLPDAFPSEVIIKLKNGKELYGRVDYAKGDPENPFSPQEVEEKFTALAKLSISDEKRISQIIESVNKLEKIKVKDLTSLLN